MTNEEALAHFKNHEYMTDFSWQDEMSEVAIAAIEKQIPKQVGVDGYGWYECSECHNKRPNWLLNKEAKWCPYCGNKICWEDTENDE